MQSNVESKDSSNVKLSVAIPTYNGAKYIRDGLNSIISQIDGMEDTIEIVVSDNASIDRTPEIVQEYQNRYPDLISYYRNQENVGFDRNVNLAVKRSKGEYVWLLSDDDTLRSNSISIFLNKLHRYKDLSVVFLNYSECDVNLKECSCRIRPDIHRDVYCADGNIFSQKSKFLFGLISSLVIKKCEWDAANIEKYIGSGWVHIGAIIEILKNKQALIISDKMVNFRSGNPRWYSGETPICLSFRLVEIFQEMKNLGYKKETSDYLVGNMYKANLKAILTANARGLKNKREIAKHMIKCYKKYLLFWLIHLPLLFIPNVFFGILRKIKYLLARKENYSLPAKF